MKLYWFSLLLLSTSQLFHLSPSEHDYHISKCNIVFSEAEQTLQITMHLFIDDLEEALRQSGVDQLHLGTEKETAEAEDYLKLYLEQKLKISIGEQALNFSFIGKEKSEDLAALWCYMEVSNLPQLTELTVSNQILMEVFDDQTNIISIEGPNNKTAYFMFQKGQSIDSVQFM